jgi:hypothetical protein
MSFNEKQERFVKTFKLIPKGYIDSIEIEFEFEQEIKNGSELLKLLQEKGKTEQDIIALFKRHDLDGLVRFLQDDNAEWISDDPTVQASFQRLRMSDRVAISEYELKGEIKNPLVLMQELEIRGIFSNRQELGDLFVKHQVPGCIQFAYQKKI